MIYQLSHLFLLFPHIDESYKYLLVFNKFPTHKPQAISHTC